LSTPYSTPHSKNESTNSQTTEKRDFLDEHVYRVDNARLKRREIEGTVLGGKKRRKAIGDKRLSRQNDRAQGACIMIGQNSHRLVGVHILWMEILRDIYLIFQNSLRDVKLIINGSETLYNNT
jgi:hypothetical protein